MKVLLFFVILFLSINSNAYSLYENSEGQNVTWKEPFIEIVLDYSMLKIGKKKSIELAVKESFDLWVEGASLPLNIDLFWDDCNETLNDGNNCIFACYDGNCKREKHKASTIYFHVKRYEGRILGADIVLNIDDWSWNLDCDDKDEDKDELCFDIVLAHEFGHMIGIGHSEEHDAIMYPFYKYNRVVELPDDDIEAVEALYGGIVYEERDFYELACSTSIIGNDKSNNIFDLFLLFL
jgi:hypothetical protein